VLDAEDEVRLIHAWRRGDADAASRVVALYGPAMLRVALALVPRIEDAEEVVQDALLLAHRALADFDPGIGTPRAWLVGIAANRARQVRRGQRRHAGLLHRILGQPYEASTTGAVTGDLAFARRCLGDLPTREREAFVLVEMEELSSEQAARIMKTASSTVRVLLARARKRLQQRGAASASYALRAEGKTQ